MTLYALIDNKWKKGFYGSFTHQKNVVLEVCSTKGAAAAGERLTCVVDRPRASAGHHAVPRQGRR